MTTEKKEAQQKGGILLVDKAKGSSSFQLIRVLRRSLNIQKIGHAGTLDPFATGVMVLLVGRDYTKLADQFLSDQKEYIAEIRLGFTTDTYDSEGKIVAESSYIPSLNEVESALHFFQGMIDQIPPMFSAKKRQGKKLYELARKGIEVEREAVKVSVETHLLRYEYPYLEIRVICSKGTYIRSLGHDLGMRLGCGAYVSNLRRTRSGRFCIENCVQESDLASFSIKNQLMTIEQCASLQN